MMDNTIERERRTNNLTQVETMFDARKTPWDGLGKRIAGAVTSRDAIRLAGLDWNVVPTDIISEATGLKIPGYKANVRDFLYGEGGALTGYARNVCGGSTGGSRIIPMTEESAKEWAMEHLECDEYEALFGEVEE